MSCPVRICKHSRESKGTCSRCIGGPGRLPTPSPCSVGGRGRGRLASYVLPGDLERGRGDLWLVNLAGHVRGWIWRVSTARHFGGSAWRVSLAGQVGSLFNRFKARKIYAVEQGKKWKSYEMYYGESVDCDIIM